MTETQATTPPDAPVFPPGRYGRRRPMVLALLVVAALVASGLLALRLYRMYGDPTYDPQVITYTDITDTQIVVVFQVTLPEGGSADCRVRARSRDGVEVGLAEVRVDAAPGEKQAIVTYRLATTGRALIGEVLRCWPAE